MKMYHGHWLFATILICMVSGGCIPEVVYLPPEQTPRPQPPQPQSQPQSTPSQSSGGSNWERLSGTAQDIGVGANGAVWIIGTNPKDGGYGIFEWRGTDWQSIDGAAVRIDVDPAGTPWVVNSSSKIYQRVNNRWVQLPGEAQDIGVGANGTVWIIGTNPKDGGYGIFKWRGADWQAIDGAAVQISVNHYGKPWVVNSAGNIYRQR